MYSVCRVPQCSATFFAQRDKGILELKTKTANVDQLLDLRRGGVGDGRCRAKQDGMAEADDRAGSHPTQIAGRTGGGQNPADGIGSLSGLRISFRASLR